MPRLRVRDVGNPKGIWLRCVELALHQVVTDLGLLIALRRSYPSPTTNTAELSDAHQPSNTLATTAAAVLIGYFSMNPGRTVGAAATGVDLVISVLSRASATAR
jgi:hypothetical protein